MPKLQRHSFVRSLHEIMAVVLIEITVINRAKGSDFGRRAAQFPPAFPPPPQVLVMSGFQPLSGYQMSSGGRWGLQRSLSKHTK